jgi:hypothetical protein
MSLKASPLVLLAPSEDKAHGGMPGRLGESPAQRWVCDQLMKLARVGKPEGWEKAFGVKDLALGRARAEALALSGEVPLLAALERYTGVAFQALEASSLPRATWKQIYILSNLRGLVRGDELVPPYKLKLAGIPGLKAHWQKALTPLLAGLPEGETWELLPGDSAALIKDWSRPRHTVEIVDARGKAISHYAKLHRGRVARWILAHQQGDPRKVLQGLIPGAHWEGARENNLGGLALRLVVEP